MIQNLKKRFKNITNIEYWSNRIVEQRSESLAKKQTMKGNAKIYVVCLFFPATLLTLLSFYFDSTILYGLFSSSKTFFELWLIILGVSISVQLMQLYSVTQLVVSYKKEKSERVNFHIGAMLTVCLMGLGGTLVLNTYSENSAKVTVKHPNYISKDSIIHKYTVLKDSIRNEYDKEISLLGNSLNSMIQTAKNQKDEFSRNKKLTLEKYENEGVKPNIAHITKILTRQEIEVSDKVLNSQKIQNNKLSSIVLSKNATLSQFDTLMSQDILVAEKTNTILEKDYKSEVQTLGNFIYNLNFIINFLKVLFAGLFAYYLLTVIDEGKSVLGTPVYNTGGTKNTVNTKKDGKELIKKKDRILNTITVPHRNSKGDTIQVNITYINGRIQTYTKRLNEAKTEKSKQNRLDKLNYWNDKKQELLDKQKTILNGTLN